jgi:hypothetical protein
MTVASRPFTRARVNRAANLTALGGAVLAFATGLVLLTHFHMGVGSLRGAALGMERLTWVNLHRFAALALCAALGAHVQIHWRPIAMQLSRALGRCPGRASRRDLWLYGAFMVTCTAGFFAWLVAPGSPPVFGPVALGPLPPLRHFWIDLHHLSGVIALIAATIHIRRHAGWIANAVAPRRVGVRP